MFSDEARLASIKGLGGLLVRTHRGEFWATFDSESIEVLNGVETRTPALSDCRSSDITRLGLSKDDPILIGDQSYRVKKFESNGDGWTSVFLKR